MDNTLLTAKQTQELLKVDRTTIYRMLKDGRLNGVKVGQQWRFYTSEVNDLLAGVRRSSENEVPVSAEMLPLQCVQSIQDVFAEIARVGSVTADKEGKPLTKISNSCDFCKLILGSDGGRQACNESWKHLVNQEEPAPALYPLLRFHLLHCVLFGQVKQIRVFGHVYKTPDGYYNIERMIKCSSSAAKWQPERLAVKTVGSRLTIL